MVYCTNVIVIIIITNNSEIQTTLTIYAYVYRIDIRTNVDVC